jgi:CDP-paratose 2-epimerase
LICTPALLEFMSRNGNGKKPALITGGVGFIGTNLAHRLLENGERVILYDNLSRPGVIKNLQWLRETHGERVQFVRGDIRDANAVDEVVKNAGKVFHFAAQVAVTTSLEDPLSDFDINARGTLNLLEAIRRMEKPPPLVFTSTNKVYGDLADVKIDGRGTRYQPESEEYRVYGFGEDRSIHFHSPYGCSKGAADQYVIDYARTFKIPALVFRMSCIYGLHQFGNEDQGWVAHFLIRAIADAPITIYGDGKQVRDILFIDDLVNAFLLAQENIEELSGQAFNIGGGPKNTISLLELLQIIEKLHGTPPDVKFDDWRAADQQYYVSDTRKFSAATGWKAKIGARDGVAELYHWLLENVDSNSIVNGRWTEALAKHESTRGALSHFGSNGAPRSKRLSQANRKRLVPT